VTRDKSKFPCLIKKSQGHITYGDNNKGKIIGSRTIQIGYDFKIQDVLLIERLKHNLLSISQLCDKGLKVTFESKACNIDKE